MNPRKKFSKIGIVVFLMLCLFPVFKTYAQTTNTGFVQGNIWYSKDPFEEGDKIQIYTMIFNPDTRELTGTVNFFDKNTLLGKKDFVIPANGVKDIFIDWNVTLGDHTIFGKIENAKFLAPDGTFVNANLAQNQTENSDRTVKQKIIPQQLSNSIASTLNTGQIGNTVSSFIAPAINSVESLRENAGTFSDNQVKNLNAQIKIPSDPKTNTNQLLKPLRYMGLFLFSAFSFLLNNRFIFYPVLLVLLFLILRFIWRKIF